MRVAIFILVSFFSLVSSITAQDYATFEVLDLPVQRFSGSYGISPSYSYMALEDEEGYIWFGRQTGLYRYNGHSFKHYVSDPSDSTTLPYIVCRDLKIDEMGEMWVATSYGFARYNRFNDEFESYWINVDTLNPLLTDHYYNFRHNYQGKYQSLNLIWDIERIDEKTVALATQFGLHFVDIESKKRLKSVLSFPHKADNYCNANDLRDISKSISGSDTLWIASRGGIYFYLPDMDSLAPLLDVTRDSIKQKIDQCKRQIMWSSVIDKGGYLVGTTWGQGVCFYDKTTGLHTANHTYRDTTICWACHDIYHRGVLVNDSLIFFGGEPSRQKHDDYNTGYFNLNQKRYTFFDADLNHPNMLWGGHSSSVLIDRNGFLWGNEYYGITRSLDVIIPNQSSSEVELALFEATIGQEENAIALKRELPIQIELQENEELVELTFGFVNPHPKEIINYAFKLTGYNQDWVDVGTENTIRFTDLKTGRYNFMVRGEIEGQEIVVEKRLAQLRKKGNLLNNSNFIGWISIALLSLIALLTFQVFNRRNQRKQLELDYQKEASQMRIKILRAQMNPHFLFNSLNSIKHFIQTKNNKEASRYLAKFSKLIRHTLKNSKEDLITLKNELESLSLYIELEQMRFDNKFDFQITMDKKIQSNEIFVPPLIIQPYVENAIWHGLLHKESRGKLTINVSKEANHILITVEDNGIGRKKATEMNLKSAMKKKSYGMQITQDRLALSEDMGAQTTQVEVLDLYTDNIAKGTKINLTIPITYGNKLQLMA